MANAVWTDRLAAPLDGLRQWTLVTAVRARAFRPLLASRERRIAFIVSAHAGVALVLTVLCPIPLFVVVPLVLGVPHVVADLRYLVLRRVTARSPRALVLSACAALVAVAAAGLLGASFDVAKTEVALGVLGVGGAAASPLFFRRGRLERRLVARALLTLSVVAGLGGAALTTPRAALVVALHVHNAVALVAWLWLFRGRVRSVVLPLLLVALGAGLFAAGALTSLTLQFGMWRAFGANLLAAADVLAPGLPDSLALGLTLSFVFLQSAHYLVWLVLVPMDAEPGSGATSFRHSLRSLVRDIGTLGLVLSVTLWAVFAGVGTVAPLPARHAYLALASFHVWLELGVLAFYAVRGGQTRPTVALVGFEGAG